MTKLFDLVTVAFMGEINSLRLQARSIARFLDPGLVNRIIVINNDGHPSRFRKQFKQVVLPHYGALADCVLLVDASSISQTSKRSWFSQQILKLSIARFVNTPFYWLLDSKNHLTKPIRYAHLFDPNSGKARCTSATVGKMAMQDNITGSFRWLGLDRPAEDGKLIPPITPFMMITQKTRETITHIENQNGLPFHLCFRKARQLAEFYVYQAYLALEAEPLSFYKESARMSVTLFNADNLKPDPWGFLSEQAEKNCRFFGIHRRVFPALDAEKRAWIVAFWRTCGLLHADEPDDLFLHPNLPELEKGWALGLPTFWTARRDRAALKQ